MNSSRSERYDSASAATMFERLYREIWFRAARLDDPDLTQHERQILDHIPPDGIGLTALAQHLALPKSTSSMIVKGLAGRGFLTRRRDPNDERKLLITLTTKGEARVEQATVLKLDTLTLGMGALNATERRELLELLTRLVQASPKHAPDT